MSDLIDREEAIKAVYDKDIGMLTQWDIGRNNGIDYAIKQLEKLPSAQPEQKKGEWVEVDDFYNTISGRCSLCGWEAHLYEDDVVGMNYCPNCGAKMKGEMI